MYSNGFDFLVPNSVIIAGTHLEDIISGIQIGIISIIFFPIPNPVFIKANQPILILIILGHGKI
ncbi:hypothetical protein D3C81_1146560 [compost metagenome]